MKDKKIKAVLFDLDGVLVDACDWHYEALNLALEEVAQDRIEREEHDAVFNGLPTRIKLDMLVKAGRIAPDQIAEINQRKQQLTKQVIQEKDYYNGDPARPGKLRNDKLIALMRLLRANGIRVGCVTNCIHETAVIMLDKTGILSEMEVFITSDMVKTGKPHPEGYWTAMSELGVLPTETIIVEDSPKGKEGVKNSGAHLLEVENAKGLTWLKVAARIIECER